MYVSILLNVFIKKATYSFWQVTSTSTFIDNDNVLSSKSLTLMILYSCPTVMTPLSTEKIYDLVWPFECPYRALILLSTWIHT